MQNVLAQNNNIKIIAKELQRLYHVYPQSRTCSGQEVIDRAYAWYVELRNEGVSVIDFQNAVTVFVRKSGSAFPPSLSQIFQIIEDSKPKDPFAGYLTAKEWKEIEDSRSDYEKGVMSGAIPRKPAE